MTNPMLIPNMKEKIGTKRVATRKFRTFSANGTAWKGRTGTSYPRHMRSAALTRRMPATAKPRKESRKWNRLLELMEPTVEPDDGHRDRWGPVSTRGCKVSGRFPTRGRATGAGLPTHAHESALVGQHNELGPVTQLQLAQDPVEVGLDRRLGQDEVLGDLGVAHGASDQRDDLLLPIG